MPGSAWDRDKMQIISTQNLLAVFEPCEDGVRVTLEGYFDDHSLPAVKTSLHRILQHQGSKVILDTGKLQRMDECVRSQLKELKAEYKKKGAILEF
jgi:anti-anti-sigma regulatory factor